MDGFRKETRLQDSWSKLVLYYNYPCSFTNRNIFQLILSFVHFNDNKKSSPGSNLHQVERLLCLINSKFQLMFCPGIKVTIDESMIPFRGCVGFRQYIPSKNHRYGMKVFKLCMIRGYTWFAEFCAGNESYTQTSSNYPDNFEDNRTLAQ